MTYHEGHRFPVDRLHLLKDEDRGRRTPPEPILQAAGIESGDTVVDIGAGAGFWTVPLSKLVGPTGTVIAVDVEPVMLDELRALAAEQSLDNVEIVHSEELSIPLTDHCADAAVLGFVLHEPADPPSLLQEIARLLKPDGRILVIEWHKRATENGPPVAPRLADAETQAMIAAEGFDVFSVAIPDPDVYACLGTSKPG